MANRSGEQNSGTKFFRTERFVQINDRWYFMTRGGSQEGPFDSRMEAEESLRFFLAVATSKLSRPAPKKQATVKSAPNRFPFDKVAKVEKGHFQVRRIEFTPVAQDVQELADASSTCANDSFHFCCL